MTIEYITDHTAIEQALLRWIETYGGIPNGNAVWGGFAESRPAKPFALLQIISDGMSEGLPSVFTNYNEDTESVDSATYGPVKMTVQVEIYTGGETETSALNARTRLAQAMSAIRTPVNLKTFSDIGLAYMRQLTGIQNKDDMTGGRWERRAMVDLEFMYTAITTDKGGDTGRLETVDPVEIIIQE